MQIFLGPGVSRGEEFVPDEVAKAIVKEKKLEKGMTISKREIIEFLAKNDLSSLLATEVAMKLRDMYSVTPTFDESMEESANILEEVRAVLDGRPDAPARIEEKKQKTRTGRSSKKQFAEAYSQSVVQAFCEAKDEIDEAVIAQLSLMSPDDVFALAEANAILSEREKQVLDECWNVGGQTLVGQFCDYKGRPHMRRFLPEEVRRFFSSRAINELDDHPVIDSPVEFPRFQGRKSHGSDLAPVSQSPGKKSSSVIGPAPGGGSSSDVAASLRDLRDIAQSRKQPNVVKDPEAAKGPDPAYDKERASDLSALSGRALEKPQAPAPFVIPKKEAPVGGDDSNPPEVAVPKLPSDEPEDDSGPDVSFPLKYPEIKKPGAWLRIKSSLADFGNRAVRADFMNRIRAASSNAGRQGQKVAASEPEKAQQGVAGEREKAQQGAGGATKLGQARRDIGADAAQASATQAPADQDHNQAAGSAEQQPVAGNDDGTDAGDQWNPNLMRPQEKEQGKEGFLSRALKGAASIAKGALGHSWEYGRELGKASIRQRSPGLAYATWGKASPTERAIHMRRYAAARGYGHDPYGVSPAGYDPLTFDPISPQGDVQGAPSGDLYGNMRGIQARPYVQRRNMVYQR